MSKQIKVTLETFVVEGSGDFPMDMLRYDSCCPDRSEDAWQLLGGGPKRRKVRLRRYAVNAAGPTVDRWSSFGWTVVRDDYGKLSEET